MKNSKELLLLGMLVSGTLFHVSAWGDAIQLMVQPIKMRTFDAGAITGFAEQGQMDYLDARTEASLLEAQEFGAWSKEGVLNPHYQDSELRRGVAFVNYSYDLRAYAVTSTDAPEVQWRIVFSNELKNASRMEAVVRLKQYIAEQLSVSADRYEGRMVAVELLGADNLVRDFLREAFAPVIDMTVVNDRTKGASYKLASGEKYLEPKGNGIHSAEIIPFELASYDNFRRRRAVPQADGSVIVSSVRTGEILAILPSQDSSRPNVRFDGPVIRVTYQQGDLIFNYNAGDYVLSTERAYNGATPRVNRCMSLFAL